MRAFAAEDASEASLPRSVIAKRLVISRTWPITSSVSAHMNCSHIPCPVIRMKCTTSSSTATPAETAAPVLAFEPRQKRDQVGGDKRKYEHFDPERPRRRDEKMFLQDRRHRVRDSVAPVPSSGKSAVTEDGTDAGRGRPISTTLSRNVSTGNFPRSRHQRRNRREMRALPSRSL